MWSGERLVYHDFILNPLGPSAKKKTVCEVRAMKVTPSDSLHQEYLTINLGSTSD